MWPLRAASLARRLLDYSGGGTEIERPIDISFIADDVVGFMQTAMPPTATFANELALDVPPIEGDGRQIHQMVMNFIANAMDAVDGDGGEIRVKTGLLEDISTDDPSLYLEVNDNGYGMDASAKAQAFGPCFTTKAVGRGLGLAAVEGIARGHGGSVEVASDLGVGTRVRVSLPVTSSS
jgi:signal transduction histidine kinase